MEERELNTRGGCITTIGALHTILQSIDPGCFITIESTPTKTTFSVECGSRREYAKFSERTFGHLVGVMAALSGSQEHTYFLELR